LILWRRRGRLLDAVARRLGSCVARRRRFDALLHGSCRRRSRLGGSRGPWLRLVEGLGEVKYGEWQGAELKELYKHELWPGVQFYPSGTRFPGGETLGEAQVRMVATLDMLRAQHPKGVIAVTSHADIIKLAVAYYIGMHIDLFQRLEISPCSVTALAFTRMGPRMLAYNDTGALDHLKPRPEEPKQEHDQAQPGAATAAEPAAAPAAAVEPGVEAAASSDTAPETSRNGVEEPAASTP
jgi:probable phosphoglycerate mutase